MHETRAMAISRVTAAHFPAPRLPALVRARWHGPPLLVAAGVRHSRRARARRGLTAATGRSP